MIQGWYYSERHGGYVRIEHDHVITLTHLGADTQQFECACGESFVGPERLVRAMITAHRMESFEEVRTALAT